MTGLPISRLTCLSPVDGRVFEERDPQSVETVDALCTRARAAQRAWAHTNLAQRRAVVMKAIDALETMNDDIVTELAWQMGRPVRYGGEIGGVKERSSHMAEIAEATLAPTVIEASDKFSRRLIREPVGLVLVIAPWNYPFLTAVNTIVPALIAGNAVILKHSTQTLLAGERFAEAFARAGLPDDLFHNIQVSHHVIDELIRARRFGQVNFTGSVRAGRTIEQAAAGTFTGVGTELGGKDPGYVRADAELDGAIAGLIDGAMFNSGQSCCGIERIYVHRDRFDHFVEGAKAEVEKLKLGNPLEADTTLGPMAHARFADQVRQQIRDAVGAGARTLIDPSHFPADSSDSAYLAPQILIDVDHDMQIMKEESFGPVVGIMPVDSDDEAIRLMNDSHYGLTASLWTRDAEAAARIGREIETGTVFMNRCDYLDPALCWSGHKDTGHGESLSVFGYHSVTRSKSYHLKKT